jgi:hypothetical protein
LMILFRIVLQHYSVTCGSRGDRFLTNYYLS